MSSFLSDCTRAVVLLLTPDLGGLLQLSILTAQSWSLADSRGLKTHFPNTVLTSDTSCKYWIPKLPTLLPDLATKAGIPSTSPPDLMVWWNDSQNSGQCYTYSHNWLFGIGLQNSQMEEMLGQGTGEDACALSERATFPSPGCVPQPRSSPDPVVRVLWRFH